LDLGTALLDFSYRAGVQTPGANEYSLCLTTHLHFDSLQVDPEFPFRHIVCVTYFGANLCTSPANRTSSGHRSPF
jgi:hypothetical protein